MNTQCDKYQVKKSRLKPTFFCLHFIGFKICDISNECVLTPHTTSNHTHQSQSAQESMND